MSVSTTADEGSPMTDDDWDAITGVDAWTRKLRELLQDAAAMATTDTTPAMRLGMSERLTRFVEHSFPNTGAIRTLDDIATRAAIGLLEQNVDDRLKSIVTRNLELTTLAKQLEAGAEDAQESAAQIRFARAGKAIAALNDGVATMRELREALTGADDHALIARIDRALNAIQQVRTLLERTGT